MDATPRACSPCLDDPSRPLRLVTTMRLARRKRPLASVRILDRLATVTARPVSLTVIGDGPMRPRVEQAVRARRLQHSVRLTGRVSPTRVLDLLADADVYLAPARLESFGLAALEARCAGLPVVGRTGTGPTEFVRDGAEGFLGADDDELVERLRWFAEDPALAHRISEHNREVPAGFTWQRALDLHDQLYDDVVVGSDRRPTVATL